MKIFIIVNFFPKRVFSLRFWICQGSEYTSGSKNTRVLNMSLALNMPRIWIYQGSVYVFDFKYARVLNIAGFCICPWFWICQGSEYTSVLNMLILPRVLNMSEYARMIHEHAWLDLNMSKYAGICVNMPTSTWIAFVWHVPIVSPWLLECVVTYFNKVFSLKEHDAVFMKQ